MTRVDSAEAILPPEEAVVVVEQVSVEGVVGVGVQVVVVAGGTAAAAVTTGVQEGTAGGVSVVGETFGLVIMTTTNFFSSIL